MTVNARRIASIPRRTASETWRTIRDLLTESNSEARAELDSIVGIASALITEEYTRGTPIILSGTGPQVRVYTVHGDDAVEADPGDELPLGHSPTAGEWELSLPCGADDLDEATAAVAAAAHVTVRGLDVAVTAAASTNGAIALRPTINLAALEES